MPPRWLLPKPRVSLDEGRVVSGQPGKTETLQTSKWADFCFVNELVPPSKDTQEEERPRTSNGVFGRPRSKSKTRPQIGLTLARPKTSEGGHPCINYAAYSPSKVEGDMIGVAFGSPTHPPTSNFRTLNNLAPPSIYEESVFEQAEPMYEVKGRLSRWKKLGSLFKVGKVAVDKDDMLEVPFYKVRRKDDFHELLTEAKENEVVNATAELPARNSPTPPPKDHTSRSIDIRLAEARLEVARLEETIREAEERTEEHEREALSDPSPPKLDLIIPDIKLDRYSVMFANLKETSSNSKLLARRSKKLDRLKPMSMEDMQQIDEVASPDTGTFAMPRRATSPSMRKPTAGFSLFPPANLTPNFMTKTALAAASPQAYLRRSVTSPARLSPRAETFRVGKANSARLSPINDSATVTSPDDMTASTDQDAPWHTGTLCSPISTVTTIDEDILSSPLKDIKNDEQYPNAIEERHMQFLASPTLPHDTGEISEATTPNISIDPSQDDEYKVRRIASSVFDAAIAEIEAFGIPSLPEQPALASPSSAYVPFVLAADGNEQQPAVHTQNFPPAISKSRLMIMNMPSPITEGPEESPTQSPARPRPAASNALASKVTLLPRTLEVQPTVAPAPIKLEKALLKMTKTTTKFHPAPAPLSSPRKEMSQKCPRPLPEEITAQVRPVQHGQMQNQEQNQEQEQRQKQKQETHIPCTRQELQTIDKEWKQPRQMSLSGNNPRSRSRQRISNKASRVLGEAVPVPEHSMAIIRERRPDLPESPVDSPPAVPTKDSKYVLPLSRFAAKGTAAAVNQKSGLNASPPLPPPFRPVRSVTEPFTTEHIRKFYPDQRPPRLVHSASDESLWQDFTKPMAQDMATATLERNGMKQQKLMTVMAIVNSAPVARAGEFGIARSVSLSRKASQPILVRHGEGIREATLETSQIRVETLAMRDEYRKKSLQPPRSSSRTKEATSNLERSESFNRAVQIGMDDSEDGDVRGGELRARAMSPEVKEVIEGLVVNGHKVMKSSVGVIEET